MKTKSRKTSYSVAALVGLMLLLNYNWVHAALAHGIANEPCPAELLNESKDRVSGLFGSTESTPRIACLSEPTLSLGKIIGTTSFAPGLPAIILLSPEGASVDVIAHEWAHAELAERIGVLARTYRLPTWFDEGLAMQVDYRENYNLTALERLSQRPDLIPIDAESLATPSGYFRAGDQGVFHYAWARNQVEELLEKYSLAAILDEVSWLSQFAHQTEAAN